VAGEVWVFAEQRNNVIQDVSVELLNPGRKIADELGVNLCSVLLGHNLGNLPDELIEYGADRVYVVEHRHT